ncbi:MAG: hypothetical protein ACXAC7_14670 [Candidatus Hodarchaeales archaeon]|jgi:hypothetical protein
MKNIISWFSLASSTGISVVSLGSPGKTNLDEQVFVGGIQAVYQLLSTEIGSQEQDFIGGGDTRKMGRFVVSPPGFDSEVISQFLLMSNDGKKIPNSLIELAQEISIDFATHMIFSPIWQDVETSYRILSPLDVLETFIESVSRSRKKLRGKIPSEDAFFDEKVYELINDSLTEFEFSEVLQNITNIELSIEELDLKLKNIRDELPNFYEELIAMILFIDPMPIILRSRPLDSKKDAKMIFRQFFNNFKTQERLDSVTDQIFEEDITNLLGNFSVFEMRELRPRIHATLANEVILRISKNNPLILLANPNLNSVLGTFNEYISLRVDEIFQEYDLASILGKIAALLLENENPLSQLLLSEFIRAFAMRFPGGLTVHAWKFVQTLYLIFSMTSGKSVEDAISNLDISDSHLETINTRLKKIKPSKNLKSLSFVIKQEGDEIIKFYNALEQTITVGIQNFFDEAIWTPNQIGIFPQNYGEKLEYLVTHVQSLSSFIRLITFLNNQEWEYLIIENYLPSIEDLISAKKGMEQNKNQNIKKEKITASELRSLWKPHFVIKSFQNHVCDKISKEFASFTDELEFLKNNTKNLLVEFKDFARRSSATVETVETKFILLQPADWGDLIYTNSQRSELWDFYKNTVEKIQKNAQEINVISSNVKSKSKKEKELYKTINKSELETLKSIERFNKKTGELKRKVQENEQKYLKNLDREVTKAHRELVKIYNNSILSEFRIKEDKTKEDFIIPKLEKQFNPISTLIQNKIEDEELLFTTNEIALVASSIIIFNHLPRNVFNNVLNTVITEKGRNSSLITNLITETKEKHTKGGKHIELEEYLRKNIRVIAEKKIKLILETIIDQLTKSYFKGSIKTYPIKSEEFDEISCIDLGEISPFIEKKIPGVFGPNLNLKKIENRLHLLFEIGHFPSSGAHLSVTKAFISKTWNDIIGSELGFYIEILKMSCELLGEQRRRKFQEFLAKIYESIPNR